MSSQLLAIGRVAYTGTYDLTVLPANYRLHHGAILFGTSADSLTVEDLRTGIEGSEYRVAFEVDDFSRATNAIISSRSTRCG